MGKMEIDTDGVSDTTPLQNRMRTVQTEIFDAVATTLEQLVARRKQRHLTARLLSIVNWFPQYQNQSGTLTYSYHGPTGTVRTITYDGAEATGTLTKDSIEFDDLIRLSDRSEYFHDLLNTVEQHWQTVLDEQLPTECHASMSEAITTYDQTLADVRDDLTLVDLKQAVEEQDADLLTFLLGEDEHVAMQANTEAAGLVEQPLEQVLDTKSYLIAIPEAEDTDDENDSDTSFARGRSGRRRRRGTNSDTNTREAFILGFDDTPTGTFVHAVDATNITTRTHVEYSDRHVRDAMGFEKDADHDYDDFEHDYNTGCNWHGATRVQGDLAFEKLTAYATAERAIDATLFASLLFNQMVGGGNPWVYRVNQMRRFLSTIDVYFADDRVPADHVLPEVDINPSFFTFANDELDLEREARRRGRTWQNGEWDSGVVEPKDVLPDVDEFLAPPERELRVRRLELDMRDTLLRIFKETVGSLTKDAVELSSPLRLCYSVNNPDDTLTAETPTEAYDHVRDTYGGQLNLPIDNHLLLFENAWMYPLSSRENEPVLVVVPEESAVSILHDEHDTKTFPLGAGLYRFSLLDRGLASIDDMRPDW